MGLDFISVFDDGSVGSHPQASLSLQSHGELISAALRDGKCPLAMRFRDYWGEEVPYSVAESRALLDELERLVSADSHPELHELVALCAGVVASRMAILAVPD